VLQSLVDGFQAVRFLANAFDQVNLDVSPLQQSCRLFLARLAERICTFRFRMKFVFGHNVSEGFHTRGQP